MRQFETNWSKVDLAAALATLPWAAFLTTSCRQSWEIKKAPLQAPCFSLLFFLFLFGFFLFFEFFVFNLN